MKRLFRAQEALRFVRVTLCLVSIGFLVLTHGNYAGAVRISDEEIKRKPPVKVTPPPKRKEPVAPPKRPAVTKKEPVTPPKRPPVTKKPRIPPTRVEAKPVTPPKKPPVKEEPEKRYVTIDFDNVDILLLVKFISEVTGTNFVIDNKVKGKVTIVSPTKISVDEAYRVFESVLEVHGFTTVPAGSIVKIVPSVAARGKSIETRLREEAITPEDKVVTQVIRLDYANPDQLRKLFAPLISKSSVMVSYAPTGMLIVTDVLSNIKRLLNILKVIDVAGIGEEISVIALEHATAAEMNKTLTAIFQTGRRPAARKGAPAAAPSIRIVSDERTNSLIISASEHDTARIRQLIAILDQEIPRGKGNIHVYYLQHAEAEDLSKVLMAIPTEPKKAPKGKAPVISKEIQIVADKATNALVITASKQDYLALVDVIKQLDVPRPMVYLEALIMEVTADKNFNIGVQWRVADDIGSYGGRTIGGFASAGGGGTSLVPGPTTVPSGLTLGILGEAITIGDVSFPSISAVARAFQSDSDVNILQTPQLLTTDNEEAEIKVAENRPYLTKEATGDQQYQTYEYKDVGVTLKITPQINREGFVRLKIFQEYITLKETEGGAETFTPTTLKRTADTTVVVKDNQTVVMGGLVGEEINKGTSGVPCLGNIPVLGWLFKSYSYSENKTNLFVFITPHVIEHPSEAEEILKDKKGGFDTMEEGVIKMYERPSPGASKPPVG